MTVHNLAEYQRAKQIVKDLEKAIKVVKAAEAGLKGYSRYRPIKSILTTIKEEKFYLNLALDEYSIIVETKGER